MQAWRDKELIKKQVGRIRGDVWDRLYLLNQFMAKFPRPRQANNEHAVRKVVGKARPGEVRFIIVGGVAVALNGFVRTTEDVDVLLETAARKRYETPRCVERFR